MSAIIRGCEHCCLDACDAFCCVTCHGAVHTQTGVDLFRKRDELNCIVAAHLEKLYGQKVT